MGGKSWQYIKKKKLWGIEEIREFWSIYLDKAAKVLRK